MKTMAAVLDDGYLASLSKHLQGCVTDFYILSSVHDNVSEKHLSIGIWRYRGFKQIVSTGETQGYFSWRLPFQPIFFHFNMNVHSRHAIHFIRVDVVMISSGETAWFCAL